MNRATEEPSEQKRLVRDETLRARLGSRFRYVRDEKLVPLAEAVRRMTSLPVSNLGIAQRGLLKKGNFADVVVFDPQTIQDHATFDKPMQYATGVSGVWVNGVAVIRDGEHTGAKPGRVVRRER